MPASVRPALESRHERGLAVEPERGRRHRDPDVVAEHHRHRLDVGRLVGRDRAADELHLGVGGPLRRRADPAVGPVRGHRRPGPLEGAVDRHDRHVEQLGGLLRRPVDDVAQDQDRPLAGWQQLDRGEERELDRLALDRHRVGLVLGRRDLVEEPVRVGPDPGDLADRVERPARRPAVGAPDRVEADVRRDPVQPRAQGRRAVEGVAAAPRPEVRLLDGVLGLLEVAEHPVRVDVELAAVGGRSARRRPRRRRGCSWLAGR